MNERSWSPWVRQSESRTCHEANVHPGVNKWVTSFPHFPPSVCLVLHHAVLSEAKKQKQADDTTRRGSVYSEVFTVSCRKKLRGDVEFRFCNESESFSEQDHISRLDVTMCVWTS